MVLVCSAGNSGTGSWKKITLSGRCRECADGGCCRQGSCSGSFLVCREYGRPSDKAGCCSRRAGCRRYTYGRQPGKGERYLFCLTHYVRHGGLLVAGLSRIYGKRSDRIGAPFGDRTDYPDNIYGYGVPDMWKAYQDYQSERNK